MPRFGSSVLEPKFLKGLLIIFFGLTLFVPNSTVVNIWAHIHAYLWQTFFFYSCLYCFLVNFNVFWPIFGLNIIQTQLWDHIWNPLFTANLLDPNMKAGLKIYFLGCYSIFKVLSLVHKPKKQFYGGKWHFFCYSHPKAWDKLQNLEKVEFTLDAIAIRWNKSDIWNKHKT